MLKRIQILAVLVCFFFNIGLPSVSFAQSPQTILNLPAPGTLLSTSPSFTPALIKGLKIDARNALGFNFIVDTGDTNLTGDALKQESNKMIKYFLAALTVPEKDLWVNLSPYEKDRIIAEGFGQTEMGRDMLGQDYVLKQLTASLIYPESELGKTFWAKVYDRAERQFGTTNVPVDTFNKVWIVPDHAVIYERDGTAYVVENRLKVMLEEDYLALSKNVSLRGAEGDAAITKRTSSALGSQVIREVLIPEIEKEVNTGRNFATLRQIANAAVLAAWYKQALKESLLGKIYADKNKINGVDVEDKNIKMKIYNQYLQAFKKGIYNYIKEDFDPLTNRTVPRKYFSGGTVLNYADGAMTVATDANMTPQLSQELQEMSSRHNVYNVGGLFAEDVPDGVSSNAAMAAKTTQNISDAAMNASEVLILRGIPEKEPGEIRVLALTSGGLAPHNPGIVAMAQEIDRLSKLLGKKISFIAIPFGWKGLDSDPEALRKNAGLIELQAAKQLKRVGGSMLGSERGNPTRTPEIKDRVIRNITETLQADIVITGGGNDTASATYGILQALRKIKESNPDFNVPQIVSIPKTMDNDLRTGDSNNYGFATFVQRTAQRVINLRASAAGLNRIMVLEVASRAAGFTAYEIGAMSGALRSFGPEEGPVDLLKLRQQLKDHFEHGGQVGPMIISEGVSIIEDQPEFRAGEFSGIDHIRRVYDAMRKEFKMGPNDEVWGSENDGIERLNEYINGSQIVKWFLNDHKSSELGKEGEFYIAKIERALNSEKITEASDADLLKIIGTDTKPYPNPMKRLTRLILEKTLKDAGCPENNQSIIWQAVRKNPKIEIDLYPKGKPSLDAFGHPKLEGVGDILTAVMSVIAPKVTTSIEGKALYGERDAEPVTEDYFIASRSAAEAVQAALTKGATGELFYVGANNQVVSTPLESDLGGRVAQIAEGQKDRPAFVAGNSLLFGDEAFKQNIIFGIGKVKREIDFGYNAMPNHEIIMTEQRITELRAYLQFIVRRINGYVAQRGKVAPIDREFLNDRKAEAIQLWEDLGEKLRKGEYEPDEIMAKAAQASDAAMASTPVKFRLVDGGAAVPKVKNARPFHSLGALRAAYWKGSIRSSDLVEPVNQTVAKYLEDRHRLPGEEKIDVTVRMDFAMRAHKIIQTAAPQADPLGGINLDPAMYSMQIKRDGEGIPLPVDQQPIDKINISGIRVVIQSITPANLTLMLGITQTSQALAMSK